MKILGEGGQAGRLSYLIKSDSEGDGRDLRIFELGNPIDKLMAQLDGSPTLKAEKERWVGWFL